MWIMRAEEHRVDHRPTVVEEILGLGTLGCFAIGPLLVTAEVREDSGGIDVDEGAVIGRPDEPLRMFGPMGVLLPLPVAHLEDDALVLRNFIPHFPSTDAEVRKQLLIRELEEDDTTVEVVFLGFSRLHATEKLREWRVHRENLRVGKDR